MPPMTGASGLRSSGEAFLARQRSWRLDDTIQSKIIAMAFSMAAEIERDLISARITEALRARKSRRAAPRTAERSGQEQA